MSYEYRREQFDAMREDIYIEELKAKDKKIAKLKNLLFEAVFYSLFEKEYNNQKAIEETRKYMRRVNLDLGDIKSAIEHNDMNFKTWSTRFK